MRFLNWLSPEKRRRQKELNAIASDLLVRLRAKVVRENKELGLNERESLERFIDASFSVVYTLEGMPNVSLDQAIDAVASTSSSMSRRLIKKIISETK